MRFGFVPLHNMRVYFNKHLNNFTVYFGDTMVGYMQPTEDVITYLGGDRNREFPAYLIDNEIDVDLNERD